MSSKAFYQNLPGFSDFRGITHAANFSPAPEDWKVIITDVKDSTHAIEAGRYKDVNTVAAAAIVSAHNAMGNLEFPYVFGGDGASFLIPPEFQERTEKELVALRELSQMQFGLELRVGMVDVSEILTERAAIEVAKFILVGNRSVAIFRGGGISLAETKVKGETEKYEMKGKALGRCDLHKLSCRWQPIPPRQGKALSLLVAAARREDAVSVYQQVLDALEGIFEGRLEQANPVNLPEMSFSSFAECYRHERRMHASPWSFTFLRRLVEIFGSVLVCRFGVHPLFTNPKRYAVSMATHSDYRKFDDMLRMILDCSAVQVDRIRSLLESMFQRGQIYYGIHESDNTLMTCFVSGISEGNHIHFIDGGNGGYAMAAKGLKAQLVSPHVC